MITALGRRASIVALGIITIGMAQLGRAGEYDGQWALSDTKGKPFEVSLHPDGSADGTHNDAMKHGSWSQEGGAAVIHWNTGWITRIERQGQGYVKTAYKPGTTLSDPPTNRSDAKRIQAPPPVSGK